MTINKTITTILVVVCLILGVPVMFFFWKKPVVTLTPVEKELVAFNSKAVVISLAKPKAAFSGLESPIQALPKTTLPEAVPVNAAPVSSAQPVKKAEQPAARPLPVRQPPLQTRLPTISMVYSDGVTMMAIIDGNVLKEGAMLGDKKIVKIEQRRVLINVNGKTVWVDVN